MSVELLQTLSLVLFIAAGVALLTAVALFFLLDIKKVVGDLSGATARKAIRNIREQNENAADNDYSAATDRITGSGRIERKAPGQAGAPPTEKFATTELAISAQETTVLSPAAGETTILAPAADETASLNSESGATQPLQSAGSAPEKPPAFPAPGPDTVAPAFEAVFIKEIEMGFTDSSEIIE